MVPIAHLPLTEASSYSPTDDIMGKWKVGRHHVISRLNLSLILWRDAWQGNFLLKRRQSQLLTHGGLGGQRPRNGDRKAALLLPFPPMQNRLQEHGSLQILSTFMLFHMPPCLCSPSSLSSGYPSNIFHAASYQGYHLFGTELEGHPLQEALPQCPGA